MGIFKLGGPLESDDPVNIRRKELDEILHQVEHGDLYIALRSSRQTGKTTLLYQAQDELRNKGYGVVYLDLENLKGLNEPAFYQHLCNEIETKLKDLLNPDSVRRINNIVNQPTFIDYLEAISRDISQARRIILMLDEVGGIPDDVSNTFLSGIRWVLNAGRGPSGEIYKKLMFVLAGALDLQLQVGRNSPLENVCQTISLDDFSLEQTRDLVDKLTDLTSEEKEGLAEAIYHWANGHPYLTQRLCYLIENCSEYRTGALEEPEVFVKSLVEDEIIYADPPDPNLNHILRHLGDDERYMRILHQILEGQQKRGSETLRNLSVIGIVKRDRGYYVIRNEIYREALCNYFKERSNG